MIVLFLGGARSGKSLLAERRAACIPGQVTYLATGVVGDDPDFAARVAAHRLRRPAGWMTVEAGAALAEHLAATTGTAVVDSLGTWLALHHDFAVHTAPMLEALVRRAGDTVIVAEEVGLGVHPATEVGRRFRDALGELNQAVAEVADEVLLVVAGRALPLERLA